tara:strand:+ start:5961 stop:6527 length:567 start_codon:yes stop_codon:yes gene_type:complete
MNIESALMDTSYDLELERIKTKIKQLYENLLVKTLKASRRDISAEEIADFLEMNELEFKGDGFEEESDSLEELLEALSKEDDLDEVKDKEYEDPDVEKGTELKSKSKDASTTPTTVNIDLPKIGMFTPKDKRRRIETKKLKTPRGKISRVIDDSPTVKSQEMKDIWDEERKKLLALVEKRNQEYGVKL